MSELSNLMKKFRNDRGVYSHKLAFALGYSPSYLSMIEQGKRPVPVGFIGKVSEILSLTETEKYQLSQIIKQGKECSTFIQESIKELNKEFTMLGSELFIKFQSTGVPEPQLINKLHKLLQGIKAQGANNARIAA